MSGAILDLSQAPPPADLVVDVCVIGSGCGGGTAARVLAEAGREVVVLEEGGDRTGRQLTQRDGEMYDQLYMDRGGRATSDLGVTVLQGRALGGGGVINACDVVPIADGVLRHWVERHGLTDFTPEALAPYRDLALQDLSASRIADDQLNRPNALLRAGTEKLGWRGEVMMHNRVGCAGLGTCLIGCPIDAKRNPRFVSIPRAIEAGARFFTRARAVRIDDAEGELKTVTFRSLDARGYHERDTFTLRARTVILAANAIGSAQLLLRSGLGNDHVGRHLMLQPQMPIIARFAERTDPFRGIPQSYAITEFEREDDPEHGLWGFRVEPVMGTPGIVSTLLPFQGAAGLEAMTGYAFMAAALLLVPDRPSGRVEVARDGRPVIRYTQREDHQRRIRAAAEAAARAWLAAGAEEVFVPTLPPVSARTDAEVTRFRDLRFRVAAAPLVSAHQQGAVRFAASEKHGAADPEGRVYGTRGVYVFDSSGFPSSASSHTMAPIITVSRYLCDRLLTRMRA